MATQQDYDDLARVDPTELERFAKLDRETQRQIVKLTRAPAKNRKVPKRDREIAAARARQFDRSMRKGKR
jgi:hypothetical protein